MKKTTKKIISLILVLCMTFPIIASASTGYQVTRVSVTINGDTATSRGFVGTPMKKQEQIYRLPLLVQTLQKQKSLQV